MEDGVGDLVSVEEDGVEFLVEVRGGGPGGAGTAGLADRLDLQGVSDTIKVVAHQLKRAWDDAKPDEATIEFGVDVTMKSGKLTGVLVDGEAQAALKVTLTWKKSDDKPVMQTSAPATEPASTS